MLPTLSQIHAWDTEHLISAARNWAKTADQWEDAFLQIRNQSHAITWEGAGGDGLRQRTCADLAIVSAKADHLREAGKVARNGAGTIAAAQRRVVYAVQDAYEAGFTVGEDLSVIDTRTSRTAAEQATRQAQAQAFAGDIRQRATQLIGHEHEVAAKITAATAPLSTVSFQEHPPTPPNHKPQIQAVDHHMPRPRSPHTTPTPTPQPLDPCSPEDQTEIIQDWNELQEQIREHNAHPPSPFNLEAVAIYNEEQAELATAAAALQAKLTMCGIRPAPAPPR